MDILTIDLQPTVRAAITSATEITITHEGAYTASQKKAVERLINNYFTHHHSAKYAPKYEFKEISISVTDWGKVVVVLETGMRDDAGTLAAVFCRNRVQAFIGKNGGCSATDRCTDSALRHKARGLFAVCQLRSY